MKIKQYVFAEDEIYILRDAMVEYYHLMKTNKNKKLLKTIKALKEQFKNDARII